MAAPQRPRGRFLLLVLVLLGRDLGYRCPTAMATVGYFAKARSYARDVANPFQSGVHSLCSRSGNFLYGAAQLPGPGKRKRAAAPASGQRPGGRGAGAWANRLRPNRSWPRNTSPTWPASPVWPPKSSTSGAPISNRSIEVNRGTAQRCCRSASPWFRPEGLIGSVTAVSTHLATVTLLDDPASPWACGSWARGWSVPPWARARVTRSRSRTSTSARR